MIYKEGKTGEHVVDSYAATILVVPHLYYELKVEVLRNDLGQDYEKVSDITVNEESVGECNPDGKDDDCTFYDCNSSLTETTVSSQSGSIKVVLHYEGHSSDCDCNKDTWECVKEDAMDEDPTFISMIAVARITLTPTKGGWSFYAYVE